MNETRCAHGHALRDHAGEVLVPPCGCGPDGRQAPACSCGPDDPLLGLDENCPLHGEGASVGPGSPWEHGDR